MISLSWLHSVCYTCIAQTAFTMIVLLQLSSLSPYKHHMKITLHNYPIGNINYLINCHQLQPRTEHFGLIVPELATQICTSKNKMINITHDDLDNKWSWWHGLIIWISPLNKCLVFKNHVFVDIHLTIKNIQRSLV